MDDTNIWAREESSQTKWLSKRDAVAAIFRHKRLAMICFFGIVLGAVLAGIFLPKYEARMKVLVKRERVDPMVTPEQSSNVLVQSAVSEEELNSEAELLKSDDVLRKVVIANHLADHETVLFGGKDAEGRIAHAVRSLRSHLNVDTGRKTNIITITYANRDPQQAAKVLQMLGDAYLEKHLEVNRSHGQFSFFDQQAERSQQGVSEAEKQLASFAKQNGAVAPQLERDITLQKLNEFKFSLEQTRAAIHETQNKLAELAKLKTSTPDRITTQTRRSDNPQLMQQLKSTLLQLQLKRTELLTKYQPTYRAVQEVDKQIAETQAAIDAENSKPVREEVTDQNPTLAWEQAEEAKARTELTSLQARERVTQQSIAEYEKRAQELGQAGIIQDDLTRNAKQQQDNYALYVRKREEARITDALDARKILNVAIAEKATVPALPARPAWMYALLGALAATVLSAGMIFIAEYNDSSFRTPDELADVLNMPVLAAIPHDNDEIAASNGGNHKHSSHSDTYSPGSLGLTGTEGGVRS